MAMEASAMQELRLTIPDGVEFADLRPARDIGDGLVHFKVAPIEAIWEASTLDLDEIVQGPRPFVGLLNAVWYEAHLAQGGDPVQEDLLEESKLEMERGSGGFTYPPGHA